MHTFCGVDSNSGRAPRCTPVKRMRGKLTLGNRQNDFCHPNGVCGTKSQGAASLPKIKDIYSVGLGCSLGAILNQTLPYPKSEPSCSTTKSIHPPPSCRLPESGEVVSFPVWAFCLSEHKFRPLSCGTQIKWLWYWILNSLPFLKSRYVFRRVCYRPRWNKNCTSAI